MSNLTPVNLLIGFLYYVVFLFSTTCHEAAHAFVAQRGGDTTAAEGGQVSLNPIPHIRRSPFGMVVVPLLTFLTSGLMMGWASAPFNPTWERRYPKRSAWMALAGPVTNFTLMILAGVAIRVGGATGFFQHVANTSIAALVYNLLVIAFTLNLLLGVFNLLPFPPLDGSTGIMLFMSESGAQKYLDWLRGNSFAVAGLLVGLVVFNRIFPPIENFALRLLLQ
jgi:Zn-dependent protease